MHRRLFLKGLGLGLSLNFLPYTSFASNKYYLPILMFHKVDDEPKYPEDITSKQLEELLDYLWENKFCPVNISDILSNNIDKIVPKGLIPIGITADDSHRSIAFSKHEKKHEEQRNNKSFLQILIDSTNKWNLSPRTSLFLSQVGDDRYSKQAEGYFGNYMQLAYVLDRFVDYQGIEFGFHTKNHLSMENMNAKKVQELMEEQQEDFYRLGVLAQIKAILAYPFGRRPSEDGIKKLKDMGFLGAVLAFPGNYEAKYEKIPYCEYNENLITDPFLIPRVCIGSHTYKLSNTKLSYIEVDPIMDLKKDFLFIVDKLYISNG